MEQKINNNWIYNDASSKIFYKKKSSKYHNFNNNKHKKYNDEKNNTDTNWFSKNKLSSYVKTYDDNKPILNTIINVKTTKLNNSNILDEIIKLKIIAKKLKIDMIKTELKYDIEFPFDYPINNDSLSWYTHETQKIILNDLISEMTNLNCMVKMLF